MRHVPFIDSTGLHNLQEALKILTDSGIKVILSGVSPNVNEDLKKSNIYNLLGEGFIFNSFEVALMEAKKINS